MAQIPNNILKSIKEYIRILNKNGVMITQAILFGSYACGRYNELSDIEPFPFTKKNFTADGPFVSEILET